MSRKERIDITGSAIANRLKHRGLHGAALDTAIEEVADDMQGADSIAGETLRADHIDDDRLWPAIKRSAKTQLARMAR